MLYITFTTPLNLTLLLFLLLSISSANAGFSLVASNSNTGQIGFVGASCASIIDVYDSLVLQALKTRIGENKLINGAVLGSTEIISKKRNFLIGPSFVGDKGKFSEALMLSEGNISQYTFRVAGSANSNATIMALQNGFSNMTTSTFGGETYDLAARLLSGLRRAVEEGFGDSQCAKKIGILSIMNPDGSFPLAIIVAFYENVIEEIENAIVDWRNSNGTSKVNLRLPDLPLDSRCYLLLRFMELLFPRMKLLKAQPTPLVIQLMYLYIGTLLLQSWTVRLHLFTLDLFSMFRPAMLFHISWVVNHLCLLRENITILSLFIRYIWVQLKLVFLHMQRAAIRMQRLLRLIEVVVAGRGYVLVRIECTIFGGQFFIWVLVLRDLDMIHRRWVFLRRGRFGRLRMMIPILQNLWFAVVQRIKRM